VPLTNVSAIAAAFDFNTNATIIMGMAGALMMNLSKPQADIILSIMNGAAMMINIDFEVVDKHFHNQPIYGTVSMLPKDDDSFIISSICLCSMQEIVEQELAELGANAMQAQSAIEMQATRAGGTFAEEAMDVFNNTSPIR
jgi:hypothetical protein